MRIFVSVLIFLAGCWIVEARAADGPVASATWIDPGWRRVLAHYTVTFDDQGMSTTVYEFEYQALEEKGVSYIAQMSFGYDSYFEDLSVADLATVKADGTIIGVNGEAVRDQPASTDTSSPYFDERRIRLIAYSNVSVGDKVRGKLTFVAKRPVLLGEFAEYWSQSRNEPPERMELTLDGPADKPLQIAARGVSHSQETVGDRIVHHVVFEHTTPQPLSTQTDRFDSDNRFEASTFKDYAAFAAALKARNARMAVPDDALVKLAADIVGDVATPRLKAERIYNWVARNIRYVGIGLKDGGFTSQPAGAVLAARYGDCKAHVTILKALLAAQGIDADFTIVNLTSQYTLTQVATANFDHAIAYIPALDLFVDPTASLIPFGFLSPVLYGKPVLDVDRGTLSTIPVMRPQDYVVDTRTHYVVLSDGTRKAQSVLSGSGVGAGLTRGVALGLERIDRPAFARRRLTDYAKLPGTGDFSFPDPRDLSSPFEISAPFDITKALDLHSPATFRLLALTDPRPPLSQLVGVGAPDRAFLCSSIAFSDVATLDIPESSHVYERPNAESYLKEFQGETPFGQVSGKAEILRKVVLSGSSLTSETRGVVSFSAPVCPAGFAVEIKAALERFDGFERDSIGLTLSPVSRIQDSGSAYREALSAYRSGNYNSARTSFLLLAGEGNADAQIQLASMYYDGKGVPRDYAEALHWYSLAAVQEDGTAQSFVGYIYENGLGVPKDQAAAQQWYRKAAENGYAYAQNNLGNLYKDGAGGERDMAQAIAWYEKAAAQGYAAAQVNLGWIYETGTGVAQDYVAALKWYHPAADAGSALAQLDLAMLYVEGRGVPLDCAVAAQWFRLSADKGNAKAQYNLGWMYENGYYFAQSDSEAAEWYKKAASGGHAAAQVRLDALRLKSDWQGTLLGRLMHAL